MASTRGKIRFASHEGSTLSHSILKQIEYAQTKRKVIQFATFLSDEILRFHGSENQMRLVRHFVGVLLCVDISGVFEFIGKHYNGEISELYVITVCLNSYIGSIIEVLRCYGGDTLSIVQNNFVTLWKCPPDESIYEILHTVVVCANVLQNMLGTYTIDAQVTLTLKTVISSGNISFGIFGNFEKKKPIFLGDAFNTMYALLTKVDHNVVAVSENSWPHMLQAQFTAKQCDGYVTISGISYASTDAKLKHYYDEKYVEACNLIAAHRKQKEVLRDLLLSSKLLANVKLHSTFVKKLPVRDEQLIAPQYWTVDDMLPLQNEIVYEQLIDSQQGDYLTDVKNVTCLYMRIVVESENPTVILGVAGDCFIVITRVSKNMQVIINEVSVVENIIMIAVMFGFFLSNRTNIPSMALQLARRIKLLLSQKENVIDVSAGVANGNVYCSVLGHPLRREYCVIGECILKARSLSTIRSDKVMCDLNIFDSARLTAVYFKVIEEVNEDSREYDAVLEYNEAFDKTEESTDKMILVDRVSDYNLIVAMIQDSTSVGFSGICLLGANKIGKTRLLWQIYHETDIHKCNSVFVTLSEDLNRPYYCVSVIYNQLYDLFHKIHDDMYPVIDLPRNLVSFGLSDDVDEDIALQKYKTLNFFRDLVACSTRTIVIFIDNVHFIDVQSWEILELTHPQPNLRLVMSAKTNLISNELTDRLNESHMRIKELFPLKPRYIAPLICSLMQAKATNYDLIDMITASCNGIPGYVECMLIRLINIGAADMSLTEIGKLKKHKHYHVDWDHEEPGVLFSYVNYSRKKLMTAPNVEFSEIYTDIFHALPKFIQHVVKAASVIGRTFGRQLLRLAMNLPPEIELAQAIKTLFDEKLFECGTLVVAQVNVNPSIICCGCHFLDNTDEINYNLPRYAFCKLMMFKEKTFRKVAYVRLPENQRHELHVLCGNILEKMEHICPSCMHNPSNYYAFFGHYDDFLKFCENPSKAMDDYYVYAKTCYENIRAAINYNASISRVDYMGRDRREIEYEDKRPSRIIDEKYIPIKRNYNPTACQCLEMLYMIYQDLIRHAKEANETGKMIFYKLKFGLIQMCMRDINGAMKTLHETRELSLVNLGMKPDHLNPVFRQYHVGKASIALAVCNLKLKNIPCAKSNIMLALRQYHVPSMAFSYKHFRFLLKRKYMFWKSVMPYRGPRNVFGWELGNALFVCAQVFAMEGNWRIARDCCHSGISLMKGANNNIALLLDTYAGAIQIYGMSGDKYGCESLQKYIVWQFQAHYAQNDTFLFHMLLDMIHIVIESHVGKGHLIEAMSLGCRFLHMAESSKVLYIKPGVVLMLAELNMYNLAFNNFVNVMNALFRVLRTIYPASQLMYHIMCLHCLNYTGFHVVTFEESLKFAQNYFLDHTEEPKTNEIMLKVLIQIHYLRRGRPDLAGDWPVQLNISTIKHTSCKFIKLVLFYTEACLLFYLRAIRLQEEAQETELKQRITVLLQWLKNAVSTNLLYRPAYFGLNAWYLMIKHKKRKAFSELRKMNRSAVQSENIYFQTFVIKLKNYWKGGFAFEFDKRPHVPIKEAITYTRSQLAMFLHPYVLL